MLGKGSLNAASFSSFDAALPDYLQAGCDLCILHRLAEEARVRGLRWNQVDLTAKSVRIEGESTKNKKARTVALVGELLEAIQGQWEKRKVAEIPGQSPTLLCPYVFHQNGNPA